jgi:replication factor C small subunit
MQTLQLVEKYRPKKLDDLIISPDLKGIISGYIKQKTIPNLLLCGNVGIGKSSLAKIISSELNADTLYISAAIENNADTIRTKVKDFTEALSMSGSLKIVILDEAENLSRDSGKGTSSQDVLKNLIEAASDDTRFILTANYQDKITKPIQSRCTPFHISYTKQQVAERIKHILDSEQIEYTKEALIDFCRNIVVKFFPDMRHIINALEQSCVSGKLTAVNSVTIENSAIEAAADELLAALADKKNFIDVRKLLIAHSAKIGDSFELLLSEMMKKILIRDYSEWTATAVIAASEYLHRMNGAIDKEIHMAAFLLKMSRA